MVGFIFPAGCTESAAIQIAIKTMGMTLIDGFYRRKAADNASYVLPAIQTQTFSQVKMFLNRAAFSRVVSKADRLGYYRMFQTFSEAERRWRSTPELTTDDPEYA